METSRCILRNFCLEDAPRVYELASVEGVGIHAGWSVHTSIDNTKDILKHILIQETNFAIVDKKSNLVIGACGLQKDPMRSNTNALMLGYWIAKEYWGQGIMPEVAKKVIQFGFEEKELDLISVNCFTYNNQSKRVIEKLGFHYEGLLREASARFDGNILDLYVYSMNREEYFKNMK